MNPSQHPNEASSLFPHEWKQLLEALRRDMREELGKATTNPAYAGYHLANHRINLRLLEALNPRRRERQCRSELPDPLAR